MTPYRSSGPSIPADVHSDLVDALYQNMVPVLSMAVVLVGAGIAVLWRVFDPVLLAIVTAAVAASAFRVAVILAYRGTRRHIRSDARAMRRWEIRYATSSFAFAAVLGLLCARVILAPEAHAELVAMALVFGYGAGAASRLAGRPWICFISLALAAVPSIAAVAAGGTFERVAAAIVMALVLVASFETVRYHYGVLVGHLMSRRELASLARYDPLTGLPNRLLLQEHLAASLAALEETGGSLALLYLDLDRFKAVNDAYGHPVGDALLREVARRIEGLLLPSDLAARLGGDEFVVTRSGVAGRDGAELLARRIVRALAAPFRIEGRDLSIGTSIGIALAPRDADTPERLIALADGALYRAKARSRIARPAFPEARAS